MLGEGSGWACFGSSEGVSCLLPDGSWQEYTEDNSGLSSNFVTAMAFCEPEGLLLVYNVSGLDAFNGTDWVSLGDPLEFGSADAIACPSATDFWIGHFEGITHYDGSGYETTPGSVLGHDLFEAVDIGPDGTVWAATANTVAANDGTGWIVYGEGNGFERTIFVDDIEVADDGVVYVAHSGDVSVLGDDGTWSTFEIGGTFTSMTVSNALVYLGTFNAGLVLFDGTASNVFDRANEVLASDKVEVLEHDEQGRVWVGTEYGITVLDADNNWIQYFMDNSGIHDNLITSMAVLGDGPSLLQQVDEPNVNFSGVIVDGAGAPLASAEVEVCVERLLDTFEGATPCADQPYFVSTTTAADGSFTFGLLPGRYVVAVNAGFGWAQLTGDFSSFSERVLVIEDTDIGEITVTPTEE